ncbi:MAG TPA: transcriptional repressor LexA [Verrucomicrobiota bacterium]|nr:transcriptional repressor LexA [Verrucomicrobiota bacterium]HQL77025.1 transcriptional repressor LexA [Verrucomicrobiota bacterium]
MNELTERQQQILGFIQGKQDSAGLTPTLREIAAHFRFRSPNAALAHVQALMAKGFLKNLPGRARSLQVVAPNAPKSRFRPRVVSVPIYGSIPAGLPEDTAQEEEGCVLMDVDTLGIKPTARTFGLKVRGDSMIGKNIVDGDIAIIEHGVQPRTGDVVAALIDGQVTIKTFLMQRGKPYLRAENPRYPNLIPQEELQIQGVMVALVRKRK